MFSLSSPSKLIVGPALGAKFATALASSGQLRRALATSELTEAAN